MIKLSIVIPTLGRMEEVRALLESIVKSDISIEYEVLIIDQNEDDRLDALCEDFQIKIPLKQCKVNFKGLSKAKNYGIKCAQGEIICFPDDDAEFTGDTIKKALDELDSCDADCVFGKCIDKETSEDSVILFKKERLQLTLKEFEGAFVEATMFAKLSVLKDFQFDEKMGVGNIHGAEEGYDLVYRMLLADKKLLYTPEIVFYHPNKVQNKSSNPEIKRAFYYSCGFGYLCKKHGFKSKYYKRLFKLFIGIPVIYFIKHKNTKYYKAQWHGIILGYGYPI